jgi:hypothetical protein
MPGTVPKAHTLINCYPYTQLGLLKAADLAGLAEPISAGFSVWVLERRGGAAVAWVCHVAARWGGARRPSRAHGPAIVRTVQTAVTAKSPATTIDSPERKRRSRSMTSRISSFGGRKA